jgi:hypothetical protein
LNLLVEQKERPSWDTYEPYDSQNDIKHDNKHEYLHNSQIHATVSASKQRIAPRVAGVSHQLLSSNQALQADAPQYSAPDNVNSPPQALIPDLLPDSLGKNMPRATALLTEVNAGNQESGDLMSFDEFNRSPLAAGTIFDENISVLEFVVLEPVRNNTIRSAARR